jgi:hypothetical protein
LIVAISSRDNEERAIFLSIQGTYAQAPTNPFVSPMFEGLDAMIERRFGHCDTNKPETENGEPLGNELPDGRNPTAVRGAESDVATTDSMDIALKIGIHRRQCSIDERDE